MKTHLRPPEKALGSRLACLVHLMQLAGDADQWGSCCASLELLPVHHAEPSANGLA